MRVSSELTVLRKTRMEEAHEKKLAKYQVMVGDIQNKNFENMVFSSGGRLLKLCFATFVESLDVPRTNWTRPLRKVGKQAEEASGLEWRKRDEHSKSYRIPG
ncbi:Hypothetical predicted protein [Mytilus galloprovincialis]|uniref:Uncharacterized protein n=1 Tax=Mytilus galloprovincialis TaxID=29158 RepID=A0A8B6FFX1_MYTGA|nr:Hypothetical predicted protein [Mytilus galloprovincialis]